MTTVLRRTDVSLDGRGLTCALLHTIVRDGAHVTVSPTGRARAEAAHRVAVELARQRPVYGRTTGVGANRGIDVESDPEHGLRLLRSHAGGAGPAADQQAGRAMLAVRLNQLAAGGSGVDPALLDVLAEALNLGLTPPMRRYGALGTADLTSLASAALCVRGELGWNGDGQLPAYPLASSDALAFISSNAATLGEAALACHDLTRLLSASVVITALSFLAVDGSTEAYAAAVHESRPHPGQRTVAAELRALLAEADTSLPARIQDPFAFRAVPQVHGPAMDAAAYTDRVLTVEMNAAGENPLVSAAERDVFHNGNFHTAYVTQALDSLRAALFTTASLSVARLATLVEPGYTGLRPFLADGPPTSSGVMILEYIAHSALATVRHAGAPAALGSAVLSRGMEEHASFAALAAQRTTEVVPAYQVILAGELVAAVRALRQRGITGGPGRLGDAFRLASAVLDERMADRPLADDVAAATEVLDRLPLN
ncbi:MAG TPA: aromatic amino acid ammonia-lyase [Pseudonocardiaceae bacterium]|jgi:histidine ammonia-lyase|nr:aromatic amino acid ammonia-lyase [Pseudonocardiaceae bacterium]